MPAKKLGSLSLSISKSGKNGPGFFLIHVYLKGMQEEKSSLSATMKWIPEFVNFLHHSSEHNGVGTVTTPSTKSSRNKTKLGSEVQISKKLEPEILSSIFKQSPQMLQLHTGKPRIRHVRIDLNSRTLTHCNLDSA